MPIMGSPYGASSGGFAGLGNTLLPQQSPTDILHQVLERRKLGAATPGPVEAARSTDLQSPAIERNSSVYFSKVTWPAARGPATTDPREDEAMRIRLLSAVVLGAALLVVGQGNAQQPTTPAANPLDVVPVKMPFNTPYGPPISLQRAQSAIDAAMGEANKRGWQLNIAAVDSGANLVAFLRMDGAQLASIAIAEHKARAAVKYRRPTRVFEDVLQKSDYKYILSLDDVIASRGGIPLIEGGKIIGGIGCSGGTGSQDEVACTAGATTINK